MREEGGLVVAFGQSFFHVDCFRCAKCHEKVTADTNLLLLSDGSPVCANCTYCCTICQQAINDEAIMAGDDSFHAHCFKCKICKNRIDELTYARTSHGIYCMDCHNDRVARNRRHAQKKAEMAAIGNGSTKSRSTELRKSDQENESQTFGHTRAVTSKLDGPTFSNTVPDGSQISRGVEAIRKAKSTQYVNDAFFPSGKGPTVGEKNAATETLVSRTTSLDNDRLSSSKGNSISVPPYADSRGVSDDGGRPLNITSKQIVDKTAKARLDNDAPPSSFRNNGRLSIPTSSPINDQTALPSIPPSPTIPHPFAAARLSSSSSRSYLNESGSVVPSTSHSPTSTTFSNASSFKQLLVSNGARSPTTPSLSSIRSSETDGETIVLNSEINRQKLEHSSQSNGKSSHPVLDQHRTSSRQSYLTSPHARHRGRSPSPVHLIDVPDGVENETDNELEPNSLITEIQQRPLPPTPNLQHKKDPDVHHPEAHILGSDASISYQHYTSEEKELVSITGVSQAYIAPALPPIRFSLNSGDFSDLLNTVSRRRSRELSQRVTECDNAGRGLQVTDINLNTRVHPPEQPVHEDLPPLPPLPSRHAADTLTNPEPGRYNEDASRPKTSELTSESRPPPPMSDEEGLEPILAHIRRLLQDETEAKLSLDRKLIETTVKACEQRLGELTELKRTSKQYMEGLTVAQAEYDRELKAKREAETEITRLRILLSGQTAQLAALSSENRRQEQRKKSVHDVHDSLRGLENDLARLIVERDIMLTEIQELSNVKNSNTSSASFVRSLSQGMDNIKGQYQRDLVPLKQERQAFVRETSELKTTRDALLEETALLNARNDEIVSLNQQYMRRLESYPVAHMKEVDHARRSHDKNSRSQHSQATNHTLPSTPSANVSYNGTEEDTRNKGNQRNDIDTATPKKFKWPGSRGKELPQITVINELARSRPQLDHNFTQVSSLRFTRCEHCGDKTFGSQLRCSLCNLSIHVRCAANVSTACNQSLATTKDDHSSPAQSMFGRDLTEQATTDCSGADHFVPHIVEKCIEAVETLALDYEGLYRKNGGAGQSRLITQLFERGDYSAFDLRDSERFPDICSVTSVLKNYFRSLPVPLLTFDLCDDFISAAQIPDPRLKYQTLQQLVKKLPRAHYQTLKKLMLHLHHVHEHNDQNRMNARNLGVVFGPTLMRSRYPGSEFSDMAGKALSIEWLVENAPSIFTD